MIRVLLLVEVDYSCTPEEVQQHFQACGTVNRVTIRSDKFGRPKGHAYVEFLDTEAVQEAILLNSSELHGRQLKVTAKRTNIPGMKQFQPRRASPYTQDTRLQEASCSHLTDMEMPRATAPITKPPRIRAPLKHFYWVVADCWIFISFLLRNL